MRVAPVLLALLAAGIGACTSFTFPGKRAKAAPKELLDRSEMVRVPGGRYLMGWSLGDPDEHPPHEVQIAAFLLDRTEVTNAHYGACVEAGVCRAASFADDPILGRPRHPVVGVTWYDARKFCRWLQKRLPTEAEWEYAARAPSFGPYPWEGRFVPTHANFRGSADGYEKTSPVGSFPEGRSGLGLLDMAGNAAEWTADWYDATYYPKSPVENPSGPEAPTGAKTVRGGSWVDNDYLLRATARGSLDPNLAKDTVGFRCAADLD